MTTWGNFPDILRNKSNLHNWDISSIDYRTKLIPMQIPFWRKEHDLELIAKELELLIETEYGDKKTLCLIPHSMVGLVAQRAILNKNTIKENVSSLIFFGALNLGLKKAKALR